MRTLPMELVRDAIDFAASRGWDVDTLVRDAGIPAELTRGDHARVTEAQAVAVVRRLWSFTDDEAFGLAPHPLPRGSFRLLCHAALGAPDLRSAVQRFEDFTRTMPAVPSIRLEMIDTARLVVEVSPGRADENRLVVLVALALAHRVASWAVGRPLDLQLVELPLPRPASTELTDFIFGAPQEYTRPAAALVLARRDLSAPIVRSSAELDRFLNESPAGLLTRPRRREVSTAARVRRIIEREPRMDTSTADRLAARLGVSEPTLRRNLAGERTSLRGIRDTVLRDAAIHALADGDESIATIARRLGFSETSAFTRAFRRWTGQPPSAYRTPANDEDR